MAKSGNLIQSMAAIPSDNYANDWPAIELAYGLEEAERNGNNLLISAAASL